MATLILTTVGAAIGGPVGAVIGSAIGGVVDRSVLFPPKGREGPRLTELAVQTSSYGTQIPKLFGTMRVAGTVIWSTDLIESRSTSRSGKGQPSVTSYSYAASFAVLLSARPIRAVGRIWAEGKLLRGAAGDFKVQTGFRVHPGDEDQRVDPLIASLHGVKTPAVRGGAYAVFENLQLADYGNRIPSLTFEVIADDGAVDVGTIASALAPEIDAAAPLSLGGFAAAGGSVAGVLGTLIDMSGARLSDRQGRLTLDDAPRAVVAVADPGFAAQGRGAIGQRARQSADAVPRSVAVSHYDPGRDYQAGLQRAARPGPGTRDLRLEAPAALAAGAAKAIASAALLRAEAARATRTLALGFDGLALMPGDGIAIAGEAGRWRVRDTSVEALVTTLSLVADGIGGQLPSGGDGGVAQRAPDDAIGPTMVVAAELPALDDAAATMPQLSVFATGAGAGWRNAALLLSLDDGTSWQPAGGIGASTLGTLVTAPGRGPAAIEDAATSFVVQLARDDDALLDADQVLLDGGANLALVGDELLQFGRAEPLGGGRWRLSGLWRGRRGTEAAIGRQASGDRFVLIDRATLVTLPLPTSAIGTTVRVMASGTGDTDGPAVAGVAVTGVSVAPPSPVALSLTLGPDGDGVMEWVRRSRIGWRWIDGVDAPLGEEAERYRVTLAAADSDRSREVATPGVALTAAELSGVRAIAVRQLGTIAASPPAILAI